MESYHLALIVPVYNEEEAVGIFIDAVKDKLETILDHLEVVFIDDGSKDQTVNVIKNLIAQEQKLKISLLSLSRNFGKEAAMSAALDLVEADAVVPIDVDLQDPPELVLEFIKVWQDKGVDTVYGVREDRSSDSGIKRISSSVFYRIFNKMSARVTIPENAGDFRLMNKKVVSALRSLPETNRFMKGLFAWAGFKSAAVAYKRPKRSAGKSKWNYWKLWNFALDGIMSFSSLPLRLWSYVGVSVAAAAFIYMTVIILNTLISGSDVPGYASLMCVILFMGAVQLISIGVIGEYLGRMTEEIKRRPVYVVSGIEGTLKKRLKEGVNTTDHGIYVNDKGT